MLKTFLGFDERGGDRPNTWERLYRAARKPDLVLNRDDVVVLDARHASFRSTAAICRAARKARATVIYIQGPGRRVGIRRCPATVPADPVPRPHPLTQGIIRVASVLVHERRTPAEGAPRR